MNNVLPGDLAAQSRFAELATAVGGEPAGGFHRAVLARLASWSDQADIAALAFMIRHHVGEAVASYHAIIGELVPIIRRSREINDSGGVVVVIPQELARRLIYLSTEERQ